MTIDTIHESLVNGNRRQMVEQIKEYGLYDFFPKYRAYLESVYAKKSVCFDYYADAVECFNRIINR